MQSEFRVIDSTSAPGHVHDIVVIERTAIYGPDNCPDEGRNVNIADAH